MRSILLTAGIAVGLLVSPVTAEAFEKSTVEDQKAVEVTVYNSNLGLIKDTRAINLGKGEGELRFMDVAAHIQPVTVHIKSLTAPEQFGVLEQNYEYDLMDYNKMLDKFVGRTIRLRVRNQYTGEQKEVEAILMSNNNGQPIYKIDGEIHLGHPGETILPEVPDNLIAKPTLMWMYANDYQGVQDVQVSYLTNNIGWKADYVMIVGKDDQTADINGWVSVDNRSGAMYHDAKLTLVAGTVNRAAQHQSRGLVAESDSIASFASAPQFQEESFFEYHIYNLQRPTTIKNNQTKQIRLLEAEDIGVEKVYRINGNANYYYYRVNNPREKIPVNVVLQFQNSEENHMGMPLPAGIVRVYKKDSQGSLQFIGEDRIRHTPKDEEIELKMGEAFDVVAERVQTDYKKIAPRVYGSAQGRQWKVETTRHENEWQVTIRNHKDEDIVVEVIEPLHGDWEMLSSTHPYEKMDAFHVKFKVPVPAGEEVKLQYRFIVSQG